MLVSLCTVCKNRADHYKQTILKNIQANLNDPLVEFILLDYNSEDDLEEWVKENLTQHIKSGLFTYYKTFEPQYFQRSHSRNMAFRLAKGDLLCNVDADNYIGPSFSSYLREQFAFDNNVFVCAGGQFDNIPRSDIGGRVCMHKNGFLKIGGYDEDMSNYGFEDFDLINRLEMAAINKKLIKNYNFLDVIEHDTKDRIIEEFPYKNINNVLISYISPSESLMLLIFLNNTFAFAKMRDQQNHNSADKNTRFKNRGKELISLTDGNWIKGEIKRNEAKEIELITANAGDVYILSTTAKENEFRFQKNDCSHIFYTFQDAKLIEEAILFYSETYNRTKMEQNAAQKNVNPNKTPVGCGTVYKNFDYNNPIIL